MTRDALDSTLPTTNRAAVVIAYASIIGIVAHAGFIPLFYWLDVPVMAMFNVASVAAWVAARVVNRRGMTNLAVALLVGEVTAHAVLAVVLIGWDSGFHYYLLPLIPFLLFNDRARAAPLIAGAAALVAIYIGLRAVAEPNPAHLDATLLEWLDYGNMFIPLATLGVIAYYFRLGSIDVERRMEQLAMTDALTGLPNRRRMRELLELQRVRFERGRDPFGVLIADVDHFKRLNDSRGHECGDEVLSEIGTLLRAALRGQDVVARWGGEEFLILLPDTDEGGTAVVAEKLRAAVETHRFEHRDEGVSLTVTVGGTSYSDVRTIDDCIRRADDALYRGKREGRNRVVMAALEAA